MKNKIDVDQVAMILADFNHGEVTTCKGTDCDNCPLGKDFLEIEGKTADICDVLMMISDELEKVEE